MLPAAPTRDDHARQYSLVRFCALLEERERERERPGGIVRGDITSFGPSCEDAQDRDQWRHTLQKICNKVVIKDPTTPETRCYTTLRNINVKTS